MLACSSRAFFSRIDRLPKALILPISSLGTPQFLQAEINRARLKFFTTMSSAKGDLNQTGSQKRQKAIKQVWKPISREGISKEVKLDEIAGSSNPQSNANRSITVQVDASLMLFVKGKRGLVQKQIEEELGVKLVFPSSKDDTSLVVEGDNPDNLTKASEKIKSILEEAVKSPSLDYSHFISLPLAVHSDLVQKLDKFQSTILCTEHNSREELESSKISEETSKLKVLSDLGIDKSIFIKPKTFHLTVLMLKLWNEDRVTLASQVLQTISSKVLDALEQRPTSIRLSGLTCMKGSPAKARVVYMPVFEVGAEDRLIRACRVLTDAFVESGLVLEKDAKQTLKLHATVMNVRHRKSNKTRWNDSFDARDIMNVYGSEEWGEYPIREIHLSQRYKFDGTGYYHCCSSISLPQIE